MNDLMKMVLTNQGMAAHPEALLLMCLTLALIYQNQILISGLMRMQQMLSNLLERCFPPEKK